ncbi:MAG: S-adenosyl-l-methionine hydroxide adenosyltransferase family protein [Erysipelotrichaceae bacterium]
MNKLVFQSDFGLVDGAVSAMYGVAFQVNPDLKIFDLTHDITPYNIFEASYRLVQTIEYWPTGTVFVSVVDPGVGSSRKSVVVELNNGQIIVTPDNGTLTHVVNKYGIKSIYEISEVKHRRQNTSESYTFHGRDVYSFVGAKLASGDITLDQVGDKLPNESIVRLVLSPVEIIDQTIYGSIDILDVRFGSLWTNIAKQDFDKLGIKHLEKVELTIYNNQTMVYQNMVTFGHSFSDVMFGAPIIYTNSLFCMAIAINQGNFAKAYNVGVGDNWRIEIRKNGN